MRSRVVLGRFLIRFGRFIKSLALMVMRPDDLVEFSRHNYFRHNNISSWSREDLVNSGLYSEEAALLDKVPLKNGRLLLLGIGGGRDSIPLAQAGFKITGVDFVPEMVRRACENTRKTGIEISGLVQEISELDVPPDSYHVVWLSAAMYSCVPTRRRRVRMLKAIAKALRPEGYFVCQFHLDTSAMFSHKMELFKKALAFLTLGNFWYERGDMLWGDVEFMHSFSSKEDLMSEFNDGGFEVNYLYIPEGVRGGAVLRKQYSIPA